MKAAYMHGYKNVLYSKFSIEEMLTALAVLRSSKDLTNL